MGSEGRLRPERVGDIVKPAAAVRQSADPAARLSAAHRGVLSRSGLNPDGECLETLTDLNLARRVQLMRP